MSKYKEKQKKNVETVAESIYRFFQYLLDCCMCIYILLILVVMPFYYQEGYAHIGTDKATFFRYCIIYGSRLLLPIILSVFVMSLVVYVQKNGWPNRNRIRLKNLITIGKNQFSLTDCFATAFGISVLISYLCSDYREEAVWGATGWYMGLIPQLASVAVYFLVSRAWKGRRWLIALVFPVSAIVFILGYLNRFGIYPIDMQIKNASFISTIGNINWYCGYLVSVFFGGVYLLWRMDVEDANVRVKDGRNAGEKTTWIQLLLICYLLVGFATLTTQGSNSGILAMTVICLVFFVMSASDGRRMEKFWMEMVLLFLTCVITYILRAAGVLVITMQDTVIDLLTFSIFPVIMTAVSTIFLWWVYWSNCKERYPRKIFMVGARMVIGISLIILGIYVVVLIVNTVSGGVISTMASGSLEKWLTFSPKWGSSRGATWTAAWMCYQEQNLLHKIVGAGPDCLAAFIYNDGSEVLLQSVKERFGAARLTNAHNEWLTILVDMGWLGLVSFAGMMISSIVRFLRHSGRNGRNKVSVIPGACGVCVLAYTINNIFSFQQSMSVATIFIVLGIGENWIKRDRQIR